jgi:hypothetical protein
MIKRLLLSTLVIATSQTAVIAQSNSYVLSLKSGDVSIVADDNRELERGEFSSWPMFDGSYYGVVALERFPGKQERKALETEGVDLLEYLPKGFMLVAIKKSAELTRLNSFGVLSAQGFLPAYKWAMDPTDVPSRAVAGREHVRVNVRPFKGVSITALEQELLTRTIDIKEVSLTHRLITCDVAREELEFLAECNAIQTIEWVYPAGEPENYTSRTLARTSFVSHDNSNGIGYDGTGVSVAIQDNGTVGPHIDFQGRILGQFSPDDEGDHGDHVSGTIGGAGNLNPLHQGNAEGADLYIYKAYPEYNAISSIDSHYYDYGVTLTSTSYSDGCNAGYTAYSRTVDRQSHELNGLLHIYSAGNSGTSNCGYGAGSVWGNITGGHKMGKNVITVGNLSEYDALATSSSRGPAHDGRIKPDLCAKGTNVTSTIAGNLYDTYSGTSMSCPNVAGSMALLYEAYEDLFGQQPSGGLMKAIAMNTAEDLGNAGPDFKHGWGRLNARKAYELMSQGNFLSDSLSSGGGSNLHNITVPSGVNRLRVMIYWVDPEASVGASTALINDLDLVGISPSLDTLHPYVLDPSPNATTLDEPAVPGEDHLNNVEQVEVFSPEPGVYSFEVSPYLVPQGPQKYFLVYWMEQVPLTLTYPVGGESFVPFTTEIIRWDTYLSGTLSVQYSDDGGTSWNNITSSVNADQLAVQWSVPFLNEGDVRVRLVHDSVTVASQDLSIMSVPENIQIAFACPDSIGIMWDPIASALSYDVYKLGAEYMDSIGTSTSTMFVDYTSNPYSDVLWYSVSSDGPSAAKSKRAIAVKKTPGLQNCFLGNDLEAVAIIPEISDVFACHGEEVSIGFVVENDGVTNSSAFEARLLGPSGVVLTDSFSAGIPPFGIDTFNFATPILLDLGLNAYTLILDMPLDQNHYNDSVSRFYKVNDADALLPLWVEDFDGMTNCGTDPNCGQTTCTLPDGWINAENGIFDDIDWRVLNGTTPSSFTGPLGDNTTGSSAGRFIYLEASGECFYQQASLLSPCVDLSSSTAPKLSFYYNMNGVDMGELHVDVFDGTGWTEDVMASLSGNQGSQWQYAEVDLSPFNGMQINVRFRGITAEGYRGDMALDDISITHPPVANFGLFVHSNGQTVLFADSSEYVETMGFDLGDGLVLDSVPASHDYAQQMAYTVTQIVSNQFGQDTMIKEIISLSSGQARSEDMVIYPNPARHNVLIDHMPGQDEQRIEMWSVDGRLITLKECGGAVRSMMDLSDIAAGTYLLKVITASATLERTLFVIH